MRKPINVIPANAGIHHVRWISAFAGMTIFVFVLTSFAEDSPPPKKNKLKWLQDLSAKADSGSDQSATVAGVRGLEDVGSPPDTTVHDVAAIDRLDKCTIKGSELKTFISEGKLR